MTNNHDGKSARLLIVPASVLISMCLGATYAWPAFVPPLREAEKLGQGAVQLPFSMFYIAFPVTLIFAGALFARIGPRVCAVAGGLLFGGGWLVAGLSQGRFFLTTLGIGLMGGMGVGLAYIVPMATCVLWFPKRKGLITGVAVAGFGGGAALVSQVAGAMMARGATAYGVFRLLGCVFMAVIVLAGLAMRLPPRSRLVSSPPAPPWFVMRQGAFWLLYGALFWGFAAGYVVNTNLRQFYRGPEVWAGFRAVSFFALANALGRLSWGAFFDKVRSATAIKLNFLLQGVVLIAGVWLSRSAAGLQAFAFVAGFNYGGVCVIYAATAARRWGPERLGPIYGWLFSVNILASAVPPLAGMAYDRLQSFTPLLIVLGGVLLLAGAMFKLRDEKPGGSAAG